MENILQQLYNQAYAAANDLFAQAQLQSGQIVVIGCSSSEISGELIGTYSNPEVAQTVFNALYDVFHPQGIYIAAQCCEHLNRAIIIEKTAVPYLDPVNVIPQPKAGGAFATIAYHRFTEPIAVEEIRADAGLDIGGTLIGMHLKKVAVPIRLNVSHIGGAMLLAARTRPKFIGGMRAHYDENLF